MGVDLRQVVAGVLTLTMFVMLGNMIKKDHFDPVSEERLPGTATIHYSKTANKGPWIEDVKELKTCWGNPASEDIEQSKGFVTFSLTNGPEYHISQISNAIVVARYLGATLVLPDIRGSKPGDERNLEEIYDTERFIQSLDGVVRVVKDLPDAISMRNFAVVKVPNRVTEDHIVEHVEPVFRTNGNIRLATFFPTLNMHKTTSKTNLDSVACLAMFGTLRLQPDIHQVVDSMVERLKALGRKADGRFVAVDLRIDMLERRGCQGSDSSGSKRCYNAEELGDFLGKIGFDKDTAIYLTQTRWDSSLDSLKQLFPKTYTKEDIMPADKKEKYMDSEDSEFEKVIDFYMCSQSDVFVPAISGLFYGNVAGKRIAAGKTQILVPASISSSSAHVTDFISPYVTEGNHLAYSCFC